MASTRDSSSVPLAGRTLLVTGASSGTGLAGALAWHRLGAEIVVGSRSAASCAQVADRMGNARVHPFVADLGDPSSIDLAIGNLEGSGAAPTSVWSEMAGAGCPAFYSSVAESKTRLEKWLNAEARDAALRNVAATVLVAHVISDTSTGRLIDRNIAPLMTPEDQSAFRAAYVTTEQTISATTRLLLGPSGPTGLLRRVYQVGSDELAEAIAPEVRAVASRVPL